MLFNERNRELNRPISPLGCTRENARSARGDNSLLAGGFALNIVSPSLSRTDSGGLFRDSVLGPWDLFGACYLALEI